MNTTYCMSDSLHKTVQLTMIINYQAFLAFVSLACSTCNGFTSPSLSSRPKWTLRATEGGSDNVNGAAASTTTTTLTTAGQLAFAGQDNKSRLASAFAALDETDQYDAVLTGLCAKILDDSADTRSSEAPSGNERTSRQGEWSQFDGFD
jgi:hypothetical protein